MKRLFPAIILICGLFGTASLLQLVTGFPEFVQAAPRSKAEIGSRLDIFADNLVNDFQNYSWRTTTAVANGEWKVEITGGWGALRPYSLQPIDNVASVVFRARGSGQTINVSFGNNGSFGPSQPITLSSEMQTFTISHDGSPITGVAWQDSTGNGLPVFYIDDIYLVIDREPNPEPTTDVEPTPSGNAEVSLKVYPTEEQGMIDPHIYGMSFADREIAAELDLPINRWGGNAKTRYNWKESVSNRASDWYFLNAPEGASKGVDVNNLPDTATFNHFIQQNLETGTDTVLTASLIGWTPSGRNSNCGFSVSKYGPQDSVESYHPDCGNGIRNGTLLKGTSPEDTSIPIDETYTQEWLEYISQRYGDQAVEFMALDNEPMLWNHTHRDVHPEGVSYDEIRDLALQYAPAIKQSNPNIQVLGPVVWGWTAYHYSAKDAEGGDAWWLNPSDRNAHGGQPFLEWYLDEMATYESETGLRPIDYLDIHFYPQQQNVKLSNDVSLATQRLRLRSTRSLWDPTYVDESWINESVELIPRMKRMIANHYPGTKLAITEYEWGAPKHINGALAQADVLGIFGREGTDMAMYWANARPAYPVAYAFRIYRNYDGRGSKFGDQGIRATSSDQEKVSIYAATRNDGILTIVIVNKSLEDIEINLAVPTVVGTAKVYQYSEQELNQIVRLDDRPLNGNVLLPKNSIQLLAVDIDLPSAPTAVPTIVPATMTPEATLVSPTEMPPTAVPATSTPRATPVPPTEVPPTEMPPTEMPPTEMPPTATPAIDPTPESGVLSGQIFVDENGNGTLDPGESASAGVVVILINLDTAGQTTTITSVTNTEGIYRFVNLIEADYILSFAVPQGYFATGKTDINLRFGTGNMEMPSLSLQVDSGEGQTTTIPERQGESIHLPLILK